MKNLHRVFIAINPPEDIKKKLAEHQRKIDELFTLHRAEGSGAGPCRWTEKNNLHITLIFLGYVANDELVEVCNIAKKAAENASPFSISLRKILYGPPSAGSGQASKIPPRMVWVEGEKSPEFTKLRNDLEKALSGSDKIGFSAEERVFSPHITLGRIKTWQWRQIDPEERPEINEDISLSFPVNSIEVMESQLKRTGPEYTALESLLLGG